MCNAQIKEVFITGNIKSATDKNTLEQVTVQAIQNNKVIKSIATGAKGNFELIVPEGSYSLKYFKTGFDTVSKSNINLKDGEQIILVLYLREKIEKEKIACKPFIDNGFEVYDKSCLANSKLIKDGLTPEDACAKLIKYPCVYQVRKIRFQIVIDEKGSIAFINAIEAIDNSNKHYSSADKYPFWDDATKEGKRILAAIAFDVPKLKSNSSAVRTATTIDIPISCK